MEQKVIEILKKMHPDADVAGNVRLVDDGILDSLDIVTLVTELNAAFDVRIPALEILPDNFNSVEAMVAMIERLDDV
ncbi:MAG: acyl carrier protein [Ruminococcaceae bacterium]|nr:acyl carrier protein [Oscillospiraceae bacterium]